EFEHVWLSGLSREQIDSLDVTSCFPEFRAGVVAELSLRRLSGAWVPVSAKSDSKSMVDSPIASLIDGVRDIDSITKSSGMRPDEVLAEIARLWALGSIKFRNILSGHDVLAKSRRLDRLLQSPSLLRSEFDSHRPELIALVPRLATVVDGRRTVDAIVNILSAEYGRDAVIETLEYLMDRRAIETLSPEKRRILLMKEATEIALRVAETEYGRDVAFQRLDWAIGRVPLPEVVGDIINSGGNWVIEYDSRMLEGLNPSRLMDVYAGWMRLLANFIGSLDQNRLKSYAEVLADTYSRYLLERYAPEDLLGFEEIAFWLDLRCMERRQ
ncbi:MAG: hypothetical protein QXS20_02270, partial [Candidatus Thorarchaeota archaeon]